MKPGETPPAAAPRLRDYSEIIGLGELRAIERLARELKGTSVTTINSTAAGGGVAEILNRMVPLMQELGVDLRWEILRGSQEFFGITKAFHNALHGVAFEPRQDWFDTFLQTNEQNQHNLSLDRDVVLIHDPQPVALIRARDHLKNHWIWRCHIDLSRPNLELWKFLRPLVERYDAALFSSPAFTQGLPIPQYLFYPAIDPLSDKNRPIDPEEVQRVVERFGIDPARPILTQISRFDRLKDPIGVIHAYRKVRRYNDCQLVLAGGSANDDPEGAAVLADVRQEAGKDPDIHVLSLPMGSDVEINALQSASTIVIQKSLREGFGLTVSEALLKKRPVVASAVGGIPSQVIHKMTGMLVHSVDGAAYQIRFLLANPDFARQLGENGYEHVKQNFLLTQNIKRYLVLFLILARKC